MQKGLNATQAMLAHARDTHQQMRLGVAVVNSAIRFGPLPTAQPNNPFSMRTHANCEFGPFLDQYPVLWRGGQLRIWSIMGACGLVRFAWVLRRSAHICALFLFRTQAVWGVFGSGAWHFCHFFEKVRVWRGNRDGARGPLDLSRLFRVGLACRVCWEASKPRKRRIRSSWVGEIHGAGPAMGCICKWQLFHLSTPPGEADKWVSTNRQRILPHTHTRARVQRCFCAHSHACRMSSSCP